eukprot:6838719-Lingulodinium_polyedra.AAC.1
MRSKRPFAAAAACESYASRTPRERPQLVFAWCVRRVRFASCRGGAQAARKQHQSSTKAAPTKAVPKL